MATPAQILGLEGHCDTWPETQTYEKNSFAVDNILLKGENMVMAKEHRDEKPAKFSMLFKLKDHGVHASILPYLSSSNKPVMHIH